MFRIMVWETNEIAGETVKELVMLSQHRTLSKARLVAQKKWGGYPPAGARIAHSDGTEYPLPSLPAGKPLIEIL